MKSLLKELSKGSLQADLKSSDGSAAGSTDITSATDDVSFSLMRNMINKDGQVTGSDVNDYLERAEDLNDEVESVGFAIETDDGDIIKIYVNATEADKFEEALSKLLGLEGDTETSINQLAQEFDIIDVIWPKDPEGEADVDPDADLSIDDVDGLDGELDDDADINTDVETDPEIDAVAAAETGGTDSEEGDAEIDAALAASADPAEPSTAEPSTDEPSTDDEGFIDIPPAEDDDDADSDDESSADLEPVLNDDGSQKLDKDGNPVLRKKKKAEVTEEGLKALHKLAEAARDDVNRHIEEVVARGNKGKYKIDVTVSGGIQGRKTSTLKQEGAVVYYDSLEEATEAAEKLTKRRNCAGATASYKYTPKLVEDKQVQAKENTMTIGSKFLDRLIEAEDKDSVKDGMNIPLDAQQKALVSQLKRPQEKRILAFFAMTGIIGRLLNQESDIVENIRSAGETLRRNVSARNAFNAFYTSLATAKGYTIKEPEAASKGKMTEAVEPAAGGKKDKALRGAMMQKKLELVMIELGLPRSLVTTDGPGQLAPYLQKTALMIDSDSELEKQLRLLATRLGVKLNEAAEVTINDPFAKGVLSLLRALGVPSEHLSYKPNDLRAALIAFGKSLNNRAMVDNRIEQLIELIEKNKRAEKKVHESLILEAFSEMEAMVDSDLKRLNIEEPSGGPAMMAPYEGGGTHSETVLTLGVDPEAEGHKTLRVSVDGPWDGNIHFRYFPDDKDGYKLALQYANQLRTVNLKTGGRPKGWK